MEPAQASQLGIEGITLLAVRPDGYVGLRSDRDPLGALERYTAFIQTRTQLRLNLRAPLNPRIVA
jgi:hypothetical protein